MSSGLYRLDAFGFRSEWNMWRIARGALDEPELESRTRRHCLYADDFIDAESLAQAQLVFPAIKVLRRHRSDLHPRL